MQASERDELPDETETTEFPDIVTFLLTGKTGGTPVETGGKVVC